MSSRRLRLVSGSDARPTTGPATPSGGSDVDRANVTRLHVNIGPETKKSLELLMAVEEINMTEALRRLVAYGAIVYRTIKLEHEDVLLAKDDGTTRRVTLL